MKLFVTARSLSETVAVTGTVLRPNRPCFCLGVPLRTFQQCSLVLPVAVLVPEKALVGFTPVVRLLTGR